MWLFMYACYALMALTYVGVVVTGLQGIFGFAVFGAPHPTVGFLTTIIYLFTQVLIIFYFIGTATSVREYVEDQANGAADGSGTDCDAAHGNGASAITRAKQLRGSVSGHIYLHILLFMAQSIVGGAAVAQAAPGWIHTALVSAAFLYHHYVIAQQHRGFRVMTNLILEVTGMQDRTDGPDQR